MHKTFLLLLAAFALLAMITAALVNSLANAAPIINNTVPSVPDRLPWWQTCLPGKNCFRPRVPFLRHNDQDNHHHFSTGGTNGK